LGSVRCVDLALSQDSIYSGSDDKTVKLWSFETGKLLKTLREHAGEVNCMQAEPDKNILVTGSNDQTIKIFDTRSWKVNQLFKSKDKVNLLFHSFYNLLFTIIIVLLTLLPPPPPLGLLFAKI